MKCDGQHLNNVFSHPMTVQNTPCYLAGLSLSVPADDLTPLRRAAGFDINMVLGILSRHRGCSGCGLLGHLTGHGLDILYTDSNRIDLGQASYQMMLHTYNMTVNILIFFPSFVGWQPKRNLSKQVLSGFDL